MKWWGTKKKIRASFSVAPETAEVTAISRDKLLMKVGKALNFWVEDMNGKMVPFLYYILLSLYFNIANVLLCVIYLLNFTAFMYVTWILRYTSV